RNVPLVLPAGATRNDSGSPPVWKESFTDETAHAVALGGRLVDGADRGLGTGAEAGTRRRAAGRRPVAGCTRRGRHDDGARRPVRRGARAARLRAAGVRRRGRAG